MKQNTLDITYITIKIHKQNKKYIFISVINQLDAQHFGFIISFISCLYMFRAHVLIIRRSKLHYTATEAV